MPAAKKTTAKKPTDRLAPKEQPNPKDVPGMELMKDFADVPVWDQTPLVAMLQDISNDEKPLSKAEYNKLSPAAREAYNADRKSHATFDVNILGKLALAIKPFAKDEEAFTKFCSGPGAMERAANLAMAWVGQMGEFGNSDDS